MTNTNTRENCTLELGIGYPWLGILDQPAPAVPPRPAPVPAERSIMDLLGWKLTGTCGCTTCVRARVAERVAQMVPAPRRAGKATELERLRQLVHNHGPEDGAGLSCPERWQGDQLRGACLDQPRERWRYLYRTAGWTGPLDVWELVANPGPGRQVGNLVAVSVPA